MGWLLKLPCPFHVRCAGEGPDGSVLDEFMRDRKKVDSVDELKDFVKTWIAVWDADNPKDQVTVDVINQNTFKHFKRLQHHNAKFNPDDMDQQIAARILMPGRLLETSMLAEHFKAPFNVALIQRWGDDADREEAF
jgi:hypothetical protein